MRIIDVDANRTMQWAINHMIKLAEQSTCHRSKCASIIFHTNMIIGKGFNSMPCNVVAPCFKGDLPAGFKSDKTCCVHAEQRAIMNAMQEYPTLVSGSTLFFIRLGENGEPKYSGAPYCSICSKMALDAGISEFVLWHKGGWTAYDTKEYNDLTFKYNGDVK